MTTIHNTDLLKELKDGAKLQQLVDVVPSQLADKVVPVMEVNPKLFRRANIIANVASTSSGGGTTLNAADPNRDIFITGAYIGLSKSILCDVATGKMEIGITLDGAAKKILTLTFVTLQESSQHIFIEFPTPIKIDRNTTVTCSAITYTAGVASRVTGIVGYSVENFNA